MDKGRYLRLTCAACGATVAIGAALHLVYLEYHNVVTGYDSQTHIEQWQQHWLGADPDMPPGEQLTELPPHFMRPMAHWSVLSSTPIFVMGQDDELAFAT